MDRFGVGTAETSAVDRREVPAVGSLNRHNAGVFVVDESQHLPGAEPRGVSVYRVRGVVRAADPSPPARGKIVATRRLQGELLVRRVEPMERETPPRPCL